MHQALLAAVSALGAKGAAAADRKVYRVYEQRLATAATRMVPA